MYLRCALFRCTADPQDKYCIAKILQWQSELSYITKWTARRRHFLLDTDPFSLPAAWWRSCRVTAGTCWFSPCCCQSASSPIPAKQQSKWKTAHFAPTSNYRPCCIHTHHIIADRRYGARELMNVLAFHVNRLASMVPTSLVQQLSVFDARFD